LRRLGTQFSIRRKSRLLEKAEQRLLLLEAERRHQLLRIKELQEDRAQREHRLEELSPSLSPTLQLSQVTFKEYNLPTAPWMAELEPMEPLEMLKLLQAPSDPPQQS
jgi:hypothetical protein